MMKQSSKRKPMTAQQREARNEYRRKWYADNKDKVAAQQERYWKKVADRMNDKAGA